MGFIILIVLVVVVVFFAMYLISLYNRLVRYRNTRENAFADIDVQLKQRCDLIPQLVETVKGYMKHEHDTLVQLAQARSATLAANTIDEKIAAGNMLTSALSGLRVTMEAYPELKASQNFSMLQEEIADIENKLAASRRYFNSVTREYNTQVETFPANIVAGMFGFHREEMFDLGEERRAQLEEAPKFSF